MQDWLMLSSFEGHRSPILNVCESDKSFWRPLLSQCSHISFVNIWTARIRGMLAVCSVIKTFTLITVWPADQANRLFRAGHCYEGADNGQISISGLIGYNVNHWESSSGFITWDTILTSVSSLRVAGLVIITFSSEVFPLNCNHLDNLHVFYWLVH